MSLGTFFVSVIVKYTKFLTLIENNEYLKVETNLAVDMNAY